MKRGEDMPNGLVRDLVRDLARAQRHSRANGKDAGWIRRANPRQA